MNEQRLAEIEAWTTERLANVEQWEDAFPAKQLIRAYHRQTLALIAEVRRLREALDSIVDEGGRDAYEIAWEATRGKQAAQGHSTGEDV